MSGILVKFVPKAKWGKFAVAWPRPDYVFYVIDEDGKIVSCNQKLRQLNQICGCRDKFYLAKKIGEQIRCVCANPFCGHDNWFPLSSSFLEIGPATPIKTPEGQCPA